MSEGSKIAIFVTILFGLYLYSHHNNSIPETVFRINSETLGKYEHFIYKDDWNQFPVCCYISNFNGGKLGGRLNYAEIAGSFYAVNDYAKELVDKKKNITIERGGFVFRPLIAKEDTVAYDLLDRVWVQIADRCGY